MDKTILLKPFIMDFLDTLQKNEIYLSLTKKLYPVLKLGDFFRFENLRDKYKEAVEKKDKGLFRQTIIDIIKLQTKEDIIPTRLVDGLKAVVEISNGNVLTSDAVMFRPPPDGSNKDAPQKKKHRWDFEGRNAAVWIDTFARTYHWSLEEILNLDINFAAFLFQEIEVQDHYKREWQYSLTEFAYQHQEGSKTSKFVPLKLPYWMDDNVDGIIPKTKLRRDMLPVGVVIDLSGMGVLGGTDNENKEQIQSQEQG